MNVDLSRYLSWQVALPAALTTAAIVLLVVALLYGRSIAAWLRRVMLGKEAAPELENLQSLLEASRRPVSSIPLITQAIGQMTGEKIFNAVHLINYLIAQAHNLGASDLHFTPTDEGMRLASRIEGTLYDLALLPPQDADHVVRRLKVMASLDMYARETPQDGRITLRGSQAIDIRVSVVPTIHGEKCVLRFFTTPAHLLLLENLGFNQETLRRYIDQWLKPQGMIFMTGPTGSGKTITAYATLNALKDKKGGKVNIVSIEDPVEFNLPFINQTQVNDRAGLTFSVGLRSLLRQDPNVILIGEIRDRETAEIAMQAGLTGHLILSSVHAESTAGVFTRMLNMGVEPFVLASASSGVLAQRLVRKLCPACRKETEATVPQLKKLADLGIELPDNERRFHTAPGCERCLGMGTVGRTGIFEFLHVDGRIQEAIVAKEPAQKIYKLCLDQGMTPLVREGVEKARQGTVSLDEVLAVL